MRPRSPACRCPGGSSPSSIAWNAACGLTSICTTATPLSGRTTQVPPGRPAAGSPPFTWEQSAHDAIQFERLDRVTDWSLPNVLFNWHRYNGINNEYKRRGIPTPYLWSGSTHYKKGKYVRRRGIRSPNSYLASSVRLSS